MAGGGNNVARMSPRQRMINLMYIVLTAMLALNVSSDVLNGFNQVQDSCIAPTAISLLKIRYSSTIWLSSMRRIRPRRVLGMRKARSFISAPATSTPSLSRLKTISPSRPTAKALTIRNLKILKISMPPQRFSLTPPPTVAAGSGRLSTATGHMWRHLFPTQ